MYLDVHKNDYDPWPVLQIQTNEVVGFQWTRTNHYSQRDRARSMSLAHWRTCVYRSSG